MKLLNCIIEKLNFKKRKWLESSHRQETSRLLPIANLARIMKRALPENVKIAKDAKDFMQEAVSEFVGFIASEYVCVLNPLFLFSC